ncbi:hypothetical protein D1007_21253 [Hordeum vulgare]|nr:hypothetical protein D1007_21253 [Hordeum vulgare]
MDFGMHLVETYMRKIDLTVVYTNDTVMVEVSINTMEWLLAEDYKYKVVRFKLAYTSDRVGHDQKVFNSPNYRFAMEETTNNQKVPNTSGLACQKLVDIRAHYKIWGSKKDMDSHVDLVEAIIDPYYKDMKIAREKNKLVLDSGWVNTLDEHHLHTTAKEAYTCYTMFTRIIAMRNCLLPEYVEGSSHKQSSGGKRHMK